jgi:hypothetical protein
MQHTVVELQSVCYLRTHTQQIKKTGFGMYGLNLRNSWLLLVVLSLIIASCKKDSTYTPVPHACVCGSINWFNTSYEVLSANTILMDSTETTSRRYLISADVTQEGAVTQESVNIQIDVPNVLLTPLELNEEDDEFFGDAQRVSLINNTDLTYRYRILSGTISVNPALNGGTESVSFSLLLDPMFGSSEDPPVPVSGSFNVNVQL